MFTLLTQYSRLKVMMSGWQSQSPATPNGGPYAELIDASELAELNVDARRVNQDDLEKRIASWTSATFLH